MAPAVAPPAPAAAAEISATVSSPEKRNILERSKMMPGTSIDDQLGDSGLDCALFPEILRSEVRCPEAFDHPRRGDLIHKRSRINTDGPVYDRTNTSLPLDRLFSNCRDLEAREEHRWSTV